MFEHFTDRARRVVVLAQDEARVLNHNYIGTEHLLLGLIREGDGVAARALEALDISLEIARKEIEEVIGSGGQTSSGHIPFTPRAKKVLELALREARDLGHNYIGTEHLLLGLVREGEGVAAQVLLKLGADLARVRREVIRILSVHTATSGLVAASDRVPGEGVGEGRPAFVRSTQPLCSFCGRDLWEATHYVRGEAGAICDECVAAAHAATTTADADQHALFLPVRIYGTVPGAAAVDEIVDAITRSFATVDPREMIASVERGPELFESAEHLLARRPPELPPFDVKIERLRFLDDDHAALRIAHLIGDAIAQSYDIHVIRLEGRWVVRRDSFLQVVARASQYPI